MVKLTKIMRRCAFWVVLVILLSGCGETVLNNPYPQSQSSEAILYDSFQERPKRLDPATSYSASEYQFIGNIYEPPLQYHYLKRPYKLVPLTAARMPDRNYYDQNGKPLPASTEPEAVAWSEYVITIKPGILYQPHPALATDDDGRYLYHQLDGKSLQHIYQLSDFEHSGTRELTADDYIYQIKRLANPLLHSPIAGLLGEHISGFAEFRAKILQKRERGEAQGWLDLRQLELAGVRKIDRYRYAIKIKNVYPQLKYWLAMPFFAPMPWEAEKFYAQEGMRERNVTLQWYPIGTGAYMLTENNPNLRIVLEKNPNFHGANYPLEGEPEDEMSGLLADAGKPLPFISKAVFSLEKESIPYWNKFLQGYYDTSGISSDSFDQAIQLSSQGESELTEDMREKNIGLVTAVATSIYYTGFNMLDPVVGGSSERARLLRQAISIAIDQEEYISIFQNGRGLVAQGPIPPGILGHLEGEEGINPYTHEWHNGEPRRKSIEYAKKLLEKANYKNGVDQLTGKTLVLYFDTLAVGPDSAARLNWMTKQFKKLNIDLVIRGTDYNRFQDKMRNGTAQIYQWGWNADYPDPENFMFLLYGPNGKVKHSGENASNYQNERFDQLFYQMKNMENGPKRMQIIREMVSILQHDAPWIWGFFPKGYSLYHAWYKNVKPNLIGHNTMMYKRIDASLRAQSREEWNQPVLWPLYVLILLLIVTVIPALVSYRKRERSVAL